MEARQDRQFGLLGGLGLQYDLRASATATALCQILRAGRWPPVAAPTTATPRYDPLRAEYPSADMRTEARGGDRQSCRAAR